MRILGFYNRNRFTIWVVIAAIIVFLAILRLLNSLVIKQEEESRNSVFKDERLYENKIDIKEQISENAIEKNEELIIDKFIKYCNAKDTTNAYKLLTDECKKNLFPTINDFEKNYVFVNFNTEKLYSKETYYINTYKVYFYENMLSTGVISSSSIQDYYTIVEENGEIKLNIGGYIGEEKINKSYKKTKLNIEILKKDVYQDYEIYQLNVANITDKTIILDTKNSTKTIYILGDDDMAYYSASHEKIDQNLTIKPNSLNILTIKFMKEYNTGDSNSIVFKDVIYDYIENTNKNEYERDTMILGL